LVKYREESIRSVKYGQKGKIKVNGIEYNGTMPLPGLKDEEIVDVMNYIMNSWGNKSDKSVTISEVKSLIK
jgi:mono/diheme cytochrome c family protein